ncbi:MAG: potassium-transporting ATPase subunit B, partial [Akkermansia sp.]
LITRGALTTFSFANDVAKYFAIIPAMFTGLYLSGTMQDGQEGPLGTFNIMSLQSPQSAILSSVIFNALIIIVLIPLALKGVTYRPTSAESLLKRNLLIYGLGGLIAPFIGIKLIDIIINAIHLI